VTVTEKKTGKRSALSPQLQLEQYKTQSSRHQVLSLLLSLRLSATAPTCLLQTQLELSHKLPTLMKNSEYAVLSKLKDSNVNKHKLALRTAGLKLEQEMVLSRLLTHLLANSIAIATTYMLELTPTYSTLETETPTRNGQTQTWKSTTPMRISKEESMRQFKRLSEIFSVTF